MVIFVFSVCIHVCIFGGDEIECYLSIQGMYGYIYVFRLLRNFVDGLTLLLMSFVLIRTWCCLSLFLYQKLIVLHKLGFYY